MKYICALIYLTGIILPFVSTRRIEFYRKDYKYFEKFDAFYKLHWDSNGISWNTVFQVCNDEEATLFYPKYEDEWTLVKNLTKELISQPNISEIFIGVHDKFAVGEFTTIDGQPTPSSLHVEEPDSDENPEDNCVVMNINTGHFSKSSCLRFPYSPLPYVCKKYDNEYCPTIDSGYKYLKPSKKCYKINNRPRTWDEAVRICYMENGTLIVLQNKAEADTIKDFLKRDFKYHAGIRRIYSGGEQYTIKGQNIGNVYQEQLSNRNYNDNNNNEINFDCGALYINDIIYTVNTNCTAMLPFICEMELNKF